MDWRWGKLCYYLESAAKHNVFRRGVKQFAEPRGDPVCHNSSFKRELRQIRREVAQDLVSSGRRGVGHLNKRSIECLFLVCTTMSCVGFVESRSLRSSRVMSSLVVRCNSQTWKCFMAAKNYNIWGNCSRF